MNTKLDDLIQKLIENTATPQELEELRELINDERNREDAERILDTQFEIPRDEADGLTRQESSHMITNMITASQPVQKRRNFRFPLALAASVAMIAAVAWIYKDSFYQNTPAQQETITTYSGKDYFHLPDGSTVLLNEGGKLTYTSSFGTTDREVRLEGEAFFDVAHNPSKPFKVLTGKVVTTVLGTAFNVNANSEQKVIITVARGKVTVGDASKSYGIINPNEQIAVNTSTNDVHTSQVNSQNATVWMEKYFILDRVTFAQAAVQIEKRFNVSVTITNESLKDCIVSAWFLNNEDLKHVVEGLSLIQQATATIDGNKVTIEGGTGCKSEGDVKP